MQLIIHPIRQISFLYAAYLNACLFLTIFNIPLEEQKNI